MCPHTSTRLRSKVVGVNIPVGGRAEGGSGMLSPVIQKV
jgi:hypothetical protein